MSDFIYDVDYQTALAEAIAEKLGDVLCLLSEHTLLALGQAITAEQLNRTLANLKEQS